MTKKPIVDTEGYMHFSRMSQAQKNAMNHVAFNGYATTINPSDKVLDSLCELELIKKETQNLRDQLGEFISHSYWMPLPIHMAWCDYVAGAQP